jgi:hypothetical protein
MGAKTIQFTIVLIIGKEESETAPYGEFYVTAGFSQIDAGIPHSDLIVEGLGIVSKNQAEGRADDRKYKLNFDSRRTAYCVVCNID